MIQEELGLLGILYTKYRDRLDEMPKAEFSGDKTGREGVKRLGIEIRKLMIEIEKGLDSY